MKNTFFLTLATAATAVVIIAAKPAAPTVMNEPTEPTEAAAAPASVYDFTVKSIDGKEVKLSKYKGKKLLIVNTASKCGYTPQYKELEELSKKYGNKVTVLGGGVHNQQLLAFVLTQLHFLTINGFHGKIVYGSRICDGFGRCGHDGKGSRFGSDNDNGRCGGGQREKNRFFHELAKD